VELIQELVKARFDRCKGLILGKMFAEIIFSLKPDVFHRILIWGVGGKGQTHNRPVLFIETIVNFR
jgi:hypothetical protein